MLRLGHPARLSDDVVRYSLDVQLSKTDNASLVADIHEEIGQHYKAIAKLRGKGRKARQEGQPTTGALWGEIRELRKDLKDRERVMLQSLLAEGYQRAAG